MRHRDQLLSDNARKIYNDMAPDLTRLCRCFNSKARYGSDFYTTPDGKRRSPLAALELIETNSVIPTNDALLDDPGLSQTFVRPRRA
jgi:hypothetical protein